MTAQQRAAVWILGDQLLADHPAIAAAGTDPSSITVVLIESQSRLAQHPYQRKKLALVLSAMRHYAAKIRAAGYTVDERRADDFLGGLRAHLTESGARHLFAMESAEYATRALQRTLAAALGVELTLLPNTQFLVGSFNPFPQPLPGKRYVMERFYRAMRAEHGLLLEPDGAPSGGAWNFDKQNRKSLPPGHVPPPPPSFAPDAITLAAMADADAIDGAVGTAAGFDYAVTRDEALLALERFIAERLPLFGAYEDAMRADDGTLYHSILSPYLNLGLLEPLECAKAAEAAYRRGEAPINAVEGFVRQIIGWREFMYWQYWRQMPELAQKNSWGHTRALPSFFWDGETEMRCLSTVIRRAIATGYTHHIERLMVVSNFAVLAGLSPQEVNGWFLACYVDAYDWVMQPNTIGMGLNADGGLTATKPYIASANYINTMSDYCGGCRFNHKRRTGQDACPYNTLYWNFLIQHEPELRANARFGPAVLGLSRLDESERAAIRSDAARLLKEL